MDHFCYLCFMFVVLSCLFMHPCGHLRGKDGPLWYFHMFHQILQMFIIPSQTLFVEGILFSRCPSVCPCVCPSVTFCFLYILKCHCWNFIKLCKHIYIYKTNTLNEKVRANSLELFPFVALNGLLYRGLCLCYYSPNTGRSTPTTAFHGAI